MEYSISKLAQLSGVSTRTLRYYDQIGLLRPRRVSNGYRVYGRAEVDLLQQVLFYRALGVPLAQVGRILTAPGCDRAAALESQLAALRARQRQTRRQIATLTKTIRALKGELTMTDREKFEGFKEEAIRSNDRLYGEEIRQKYGAGAVEASYDKFRAMTEAGWQDARQLEETLNQALREAVASGDPAGPAAQRACGLHRQWLCLYWPEGSYTKEAHAALADGYAADRRFRAYYEAIAPGCTDFLREAIHIYCR